MHVKFIKPFVTSALLSLASASFSSQVTFVNGSSGNEVMSIGYKIITQDKGRTLIQSKALNVSAGTVINLELGKHQSVGVVPISVNGHLIPIDSDFRAPENCAVMLEDNQASAQLTLTYVNKTATSKAYISCSKKMT